MKLIIAFIKFLAFLIVALLYLIIAIPYAIFSWIQEKLKRILVVLAPNEDTTSKSGTI